MASDWPVDVCHKAQHYCPSALFWARTCCAGWNFLFVFWSGSLHVYINPYCLPTLHNCMGNARLLAAAQNCHATHRSHVGKEYTCLLDADASSICYKKQTLLRLDAENELGWQHVGRTMQPQAGCQIVCGLSHQLCQQNVGEIFILWLPGP